MALPGKRILKNKLPKPTAEAGAQTYAHPESENLMRPGIGTQAQFKKKKEPKKYRYDSSLVPSPGLGWTERRP